MNFFFKKGSFRFRPQDVPGPGRHVGQVHHRDLGHQGREGRRQRLPQVRREGVRGREDGHGHGNLT